MVTLHFSLIISVKYTIYHQTMHFMLCILNYVFWTLKTMYFALKKQNDFFEVPPAKCPFGPREASPVGPVRIDPKKAPHYLKKNVRR